jgi:predicted permease
MNIRQWWLQISGRSSGARTSELDEEIASHLQMAAEDAVARGAKPAQAREAAAREFGNVALVKDVTQAAWGRSWLESLGQDLKYALRQLARSPGFALTAMLTLALGIGANTILFSIVDGVLLHPLPYPHPEELVTVHASKKAFSEGSISYLNFRDWQRDNRSLAAIAISRGTGYNMTGLGDAEEVRGQLVSSDFFSILGVKPVLGRLFAPHEDEQGQEPVVILSPGLWERKFASSRDVLGKPLTLDGRNYTIVGVLPASFRLAINSFRPADLYVPIGQFRNPALNDRAAGLGIHGIARLKPGVTLAQAQEDMLRVSERLEEAYPEQDKNIRAKLVPFEFALVRDVKPLLVVLMSAVGFVLLIACLNIANLQLARANARAQEFAVRSALGAARSRLVRQLLTENVLLAVCGGVGGLVLAAFGTSFVVRMLPQGLPRAEEIHMSAEVLGFSAAIALAAGVFFGLAPALKLAQSPAVQEGLKERGRSVSPARHRMQQGLVIVQMATALVLLAGAGLMTRSLMNLLRVETGFRPQGVLMFGFQPPPSLIGSSSEAIRAYVRAAHEQIASVPGVDAVSFSWAALPLTSDDEQQFWLGREARPTSQDAMHWAVRYIVEPDYLKAMGIPLVKGRFLAPSDDAHAPRVVVVDDVFARQYFGSENPIGQQLHLDNFDEPALIVGVVGHVNQWGLDADGSSQVRAEVYESLLQLPEVQTSLIASGMDTVVHTRADAAGSFRSIQAAVAAMNHQQVVYNPQTMDSVIADTLAPRRFLMTLLAAFAGTALLLASIGMYGVLAYLVGERRQEIGIRMALGASRGRMIGWVLRSGGRLAAIGAVAGLLGALVLTRFLASAALTFGVPSYDPWVLGAVTALLMMVALVACYIPARRAAAIDPMEALRTE